MDHDFDSAEQPPAPGGRPLGRIVAIGGDPGSGKSTVGRVLATELGAALVDLDTVTNPLIAEIASLTGAGDDLDHPSLRGSVRTARYQCLWDTSAEIASLGCDVVAVAPFSAEIEDSDRWSASPGPSLGALLVALTVDPAESLRRRISRGERRDNSLTASDLGRSLAPGRHVTLVLNGAGAVPAAVIAIRTLLR